MIKCILSSAITFNNIKTEIVNNSAGSEGDTLSQYKIEWVTDKLAAGYATLSYEDLAFIKEKNISAIVNLCGEFCDLYEIQGKSGFDVFYLPLFDACAPDMADLERGLEWIENKIKADRNVLVHCRFGMGRTGMFVFAYLLRRYLNPSFLLQRVPACRRHNLYMNSAFLQMSLAPLHYKKCLLQASRSCQPFPQG